MAKTKNVFEAFALKLYYTEQKPAEALPALYNSVGRVIPRRVARQHCPTPFHHGTKNYEYLGTIQYMSSLRGVESLLFLAALADN